MRWIEAKFFIVRYDRHGGRDVVAIKNNGRIGTLIRVATEHGGLVISPKFDRRTGDVAVTDSDGNLFLAEEQFI